jgi:hypothetical protein
MWNFAASYLQKYMPPHISSKILLTQSIQKLEPIVGEQEALEISFGAISHFLSLTKPQILPEQNLIL